jgi:hypothetical protein
MCTPIPARHQANGSTPHTPAGIVHRGVHSNCVVISLDVLQCAQAEANGCRRQSYSAMGCRPHCLRVAISQEWRPLGQWETSQTHKGNLAGRATE